MISFTGFLSEVSPQEKTTTAWIRAVNIVTQSLLQLSTYLGDSIISTTKLNLFQESLKLAELGSETKSNAIDRARILQALGMEMERRGDAEFV